MLSSVLFLMFIDTYLLSLPPDNKYKMISCRSHCKALPTVVRVEEYSNRQNYRS